MIPESFIEELKYRTSIEEIISSYTTLKRAGRSLKGLCPFHSERSPSFTVYPENGSFYCFGCGVGGDVVTFAKLAEHLEYVEALKFLAQKAGIAMPEDVADDKTAKLKMRILEINRTTAKFFHNQLSTERGEIGLRYFRDRGLSDKTIRTFGLGYSPDSFDSCRNHLVEKGFTKEELLVAGIVREGKNDSCYDFFRNRVMFPIIDLRGNVVGFGGRILGDGQPKYLNSSDTPIFKKSRGLFALNKAKSTKESHLILTEGYMDAIAVQQAGLDNAVATLGTALTGEQARLIANYTNEVIIAYDSDEAGKKATNRASTVLAQAGLKIRVISMKGSKDPDEYIKKHSPQGFIRLIKESESAVEHQITVIREKFDLDTEDGKVRFLKEFCEFMSTQSDRIAVSVYINKISTELLVSSDALSEQIKMIRAKKSKTEKKKFDQSLTSYPHKAVGQGRDPQRAQNMRYALAEDKLLAILMKHQDYFHRFRHKILPCDIVTDSNREIFTAILSLLEKGKEVNLTILCETLSTDQMSRLTRLIVESSEFSNTLKEAEDYINVILSKKSEKSDEQVGSMDEAELKEFISSIAANKK